MRRRDFLRITLAAGATAGLAAFARRRACADNAAVQPSQAFEARTLADALRQTVGKGDVPLSARVKLKAPATAENGAEVPVSVEVDSPMTADDYVKTVYLYVDKNPKPLASEFHFTPASGRAYFRLRIKMGDTSNVRAVAKTNKGLLMAAVREVRVTISGCG
jgi:sulfur-oxidizing protein SoxY